MGRSTRPKVCVRCGVEKERAAFKTQEPHGCVPYCIDCTKRRGGFKERLRCKSCDIEKPREHFAIDPRGRPSRSCTGCRRHGWSKNHCPKGHPRGGNYRISPSGVIKCLECFREHARRRDPESRKAEHISWSRVRAERAGREYRSPEERAREAEVRATAVAQGAVRREWWRLCASEAHNALTASERYRRRYRCDPKFREREIARTKAKKFERRSKLEADGVAPRVLERMRKRAKVCAYCGDDVIGKSHIDHVHPLARGGSNDPSNLVPACATCNLAKSDKMPAVVVVDDRDPSSVRLALIFEDGSVMGDERLVQSALAA